MIGAYAVERDYSQYLANVSSAVLAIVGTATKGPIGEAVTVTSPQDLVSKFGPLKTDCYGLYAAQYFLSQASKLYFVRAAGDSVAASKVTITGETADEGDIEAALVVETLEKGTYYNGYTLTLVANPGEENSIDSYTLTIKNKNGLTVESISEITLDELVVGYTSNFIKVTSKDITTAKLVGETFTFAGGNDGISDIDAGDYITAANVLTRESIDINLIATPGVSDASVITAVLSIAENRGDSLYIIDPPKGLTRDGVIQWVDGGGSYEHVKFNSSYGAVYYDWLTIYDSVNKVKVQVPPSVAVCATIAYSDRISELWYAPAGLTRGLITGVLESVTPLDKQDVNLLYESNINAIYEDPQVGLVLWGQKTLYREDTALNRVNVRRLLNYLKKVIVAASNYLTFDPNDRVTWNDFEMKIIPTLDSVQNRRGIYSYSLVKGESIITDNDVDNYSMPCMVMISPTKAAEEIPIYFVLTSSGADFNSVLESNGVIGE